jgi:hypothetical protein
VPCAFCAGLSTAKINIYVQKLYSKKPNPPEFKKYSIDGKKGYGFNRVKLVLTDIAFNRMHERNMRRRRDEEEVRQEVRKRAFSELEN